MKSIQDTNLWKRTLASVDDEHKEQRDNLRTTLLNMHKQVEPLVSAAHRDCFGLTIHDISHLDALWEMADLIAGPDFPLNPVEAFVFGASVLLHDAGMAVAAYPGGFTEIKKSTAWRNAVASMLRREQLQVSEAAIASPPQRLVGPATFETLRALHAERAEQLATQEWKIPNSTSPIYLIDNRELREFYGVRIGRIAHSHHWDIDVVSREFALIVGAQSDLPSCWTLDELKVAALLRCADAAHIDERRAPAMAFALMQPTGTSFLHWGFQNKLSQPTVQGSSLVYSSGRDFGRSEVAQWWLCFDVAQMIDGELRSSNAALKDHDLTFAATGVMGIESPRQFARHVRPAGWEPVDAKVRVSDPIHLARTLGGPNLYGRNSMAPIRELIQNGSDAIRARRQQLKLGEEYGNIKLTLERRQLPENSAEEVWLHVDDNGIGMSERVMTGPLIDFGRSIWSSSLLREEYRDLESSDIKPIGKFGIGFFSVFLLSDEVRVISKRYDQGSSDIRVLEFDQLSSRPILRKGSPQELPEGYSTRVSLKLLEPNSFFPVQEPESVDRDDLLLPDFSCHLKRLTSALNIKFELSDGLGNRSFVHSANWQTVSADTFLEELFAPVRSKMRARLVKMYAPFLTSFSGTLKADTGRAALNFEQSDRHRVAPTAFISVGGLVSQAQRTSYALDQYFVGVQSGDTFEASRQTAVSTLSKETIAAWATEQVSQLDRAKFLPHQEVPLAQMVYRIGGNPGSLPFCYLGGRYVDLSELSAFLRSNVSLHLRVKGDVARRPQFEDLSDLRIPDLSPEVKPGIIIFPHRSEYTEIYRADNDVRSLQLPQPVSTDEAGFKSDTMSPLFALVRQHWGDFQASFEVLQAFSGTYVSTPASKLVLTLSRKP